MGASALFLGLKWKAVLARSEAAKKASTKEINYSVAPNRSGTYPSLLSSTFQKERLLICGLICRWWSLIDNEVMITNTGREGVEKKRLDGIQTRLVHTM